MQGQDSGAFLRYSLYGVMSKSLHYPVKQIIICGCESEWTAASLKKDSLPDGSLANVS